MPSRGQTKAAKRERAGKAFLRGYERIAHAIRPSPSSLHSDSNAPPNGDSSPLAITGPHTSVHPGLIQGMNASGSQTQSVELAGNLAPNATGDGPVPSAAPPTSDTPEYERSGLLTGVGTTLRALGESSDAFPPLKSAVGRLIACLDTVQSATSNEQEYDQLTSELTTIAASLNKYIIALGQEDADGSLERVARQDREDIITSYRVIEGLFRQLQTDINLRVLGNTNKLTDINLQILGNTNKLPSQRVSSLLQEMSPVDDARYDSSYATTVKRRACTPETRERVQADLQDWVGDPTGAKVYWMNGMAGTGKTTIAYSLCEWLENENLLAASFFCSRTSSACRNVNLIVPTIAYQLARHSSTFRSALCRELEADPDVGKLNVVRQFERLVRDPLTNSKDKALDGAVVVIDALDECEDDYGVRLIVGTLLKLGANLPLRFFVTSRPDPAIQDNMMRPGGYSPATLHLHDIEKSIVEGDIKTFLHTELEFVSLPPSKIDQLAQRAGNLFIYAATAVRYIMSRRGDPASRLDAMLAIDSQPTNTGQYNKKYKELDALYTAVLEAALMDEELEQVEVEHMRLVLWTVICAQEPLAIPALASLAGLTEGQVSSSLKPLYSVLHVSKSRGVVSTLHASFPNYMLDRRRSQDLHCDESQHNAFLALRCFWIMEQKLRFNICGLESSFEWDRDVPNLEQRIEAHISPVLFYSSQYWGEHLRQSSASDELYTALIDFLMYHLLFWMEVLNIRQFIAKGVIILSNSEKWLLMQNAPATLQKETRDARDFVTRFAAGMCNRSTPHIYISALPFCAKSSSVYAHYWGRTQGLMDVQGKVISQRDRAAQATWTTNDWVLSVAFSPDGTKIAAGCDDGHILVWEAHAGDIVVGPLGGHRDSVSSVAFSPNGTRFVSGSSDFTIRVWDTRTGTTVVRPFEGHSDRVNSVAFSSDGTRIVSGSVDRTILVWDASNGDVVFGPLEGHEDSVNSVAFSPDGGYIASGSADMTIRVWSTYTGSLASEPLRGHSGSVTSLAFSPDGAYIVSGSADLTIRVWDARAGNLITGPLKAHTRSVNSVAFSPDGTRIASGSDDETSLVWDTHTGSIVAGPFSGHTNMVQSVAFSPDGVRIATGSYDRTVRVWDTRVGATAEELSAGGHAHYVTSVAFSPDGELIVSGSDDKTIRVWNAHTGDAVVRPLEGHTGPIHSVAFAPNSTHVVSGSGDSTVRVWNIRTGNGISGAFEGHSARVNCVAFSPDGTRVVSGSDDNNIWVWDSSNGHVFAGPLEGHTNSVESTAFSPDGVYIVSGSDDGTIRVWDSSTGGMIITTPSEGSMGRVRSVTFSPDGARIASCSGSGGVRVWDIRTGRLVEGPFEGHMNSVSSVVFLPGGIRVVSKSGLSKCPVVWDARTGNVLAGPFSGHTGNVKSVAFSPDGACVVSGSTDQAIRVSHCYLNIVAKAPYLKLLQSTITTSRETETTPESGPHESPGALSIPSPSVLPPAPHDHRPKETSACRVDFDCHKDGWVISGGVRLFWTPPDLRAHIPFPHNRVVIGHQGSLSINYENLLLGERWIECYKP